MSHSTPDLPREARPPGDAALSPASLYGHLQDLERRVARGRRVGYVHLGVTALVLGALLITLARGPAEILADGPDGRARIRASAEGSSALIEFLDERGRVVTTIGQLGGTGLLELERSENPPSAPPDVQLSASRTGLSLNRSKGEITLEIDATGRPRIGMLGGDGEPLWNMFERSAGGLHEYRRASAAIDP